jgi:DNA-binding LytR/AlgR family response regulator
MRHLRVALCDDVEKERAFFYDMCKLIKERNDIEIRLKEYVSGDSLLYDLEDLRLLHSVDIILLDIKMPGKNGIEVASDLRKRGYQGAIIFITKSKEKWRGAFDVNALNYIVKDEEGLESRFAKVFMIAYEEALKKRDETLLFSSLGEVRKIGIRSISHFKITDHLVTVYYDEETFEFISSLSKIEEQLFGNEDFYRISRNCIVSISHIYRLEEKSVTMLTGTVIPVSSRKMKGLKEAIKKIDKVRD